MKIAVVGCSGFIGRHVVEHFLNANFKVVGISRHATHIDAPWTSHPDLVLSDVDVSDTDQLTAALSDCEKAVYLIHGLASSDFQSHETDSSQSFVKAAQDIKQIVYISGLGQGPRLSPHLKSRQRTGKILREHIPTVELRAAMVLAPGSVGYDIIESLTSKLPLLLLPRSAQTTMQPITLDDLTRYIDEAIQLPDNHSQIIEVGGPDTMSYQELIRRFITHCGKRRIVIRLPFLPAMVAAWWLDLFTPKHHARIGQHMIASLDNQMIVTDTSAAELFPHISCEPIEKAIRCS